MVENSMAVLFIPRLCFRQFKIFIKNRNTTALVLVYDLPEYDQLMDELKTLDDGYVAGRDSLNALLNEADKVMLTHGGDPEVYTASRPDDSDVFTTDKFLYMHNLTEAQIMEKGKEYLLSHIVYTQAELDNAVFMLGTAYDHSETEAVDACNLINCHLPFSAQKP